jgi:flagellin-like hook-associated protein FlgL
LRFKPLFPLLALSLGFLGVVACGAGIAVVWSAGSRLCRTNEKVFDQIDESLGNARDRVLDAQRRVQESKITTEDIQQSLKNWTRKKSSEQLESRLAIGDKIETLSQGLHQADVWLELSGTSFQNVRRALEMGSSLDAPVDTDLVDPLIEKLAKLRSQLSQATETVDGIHERVAENSEGEPRQERIDQAIQLALRALATLGQIDSRLGESSDRLSDTQTKGQQLKSRTDAYILAARIAAVLLLAWMAIGQVSLCRSGWNAYRQM